MTPKKKRELLQRRRWRVREKVSGTSIRPRMSVCFTGEHIYIQFIDDSLGRTLASASTCSKTEEGARSESANVKGARVLGKLAAHAALEHGIKTVVFDRGGARYTGKLKALADAAREAGLKF